MHSTVCALLMMNVLFQRSVSLMVQLDREMVDGVVVVSNSYW